MSKDEILAAIWIIAALIAMYVYNRIDNKLDNK